MLKKYNIDVNLTSPQWNGSTKLQLFEKRINKNEKRDLESYAETAIGTKWVLKIQDNNDYKKEELELHARKSIKDIKKLISRNVKFNEFITEVSKDKADAENLLTEIAKRAIQNGK